MSTINRVIFKDLKIRYSCDTTKEISLALESSTILRSAKYAGKKTQININFLKFTPLHNLRLFFITVVRKTKDYFLGRDASCRCILKGTTDLVVGKKYEIYGRLTKEKYLVLTCEKVILINYKKLTHQLL